MITRRRLLKTGGTLAIAGLGPAMSRCSPPGLKTGEGGKAQPNILLVMTDQQTCRAISAAGNPHVKTPAMDALARGGVRFERSYCTSPVCGPARSSIITGRMPQETGVNYNVDTPDPGIPNLGEIFRQAGYRTVWAGKWHLPRMYPHKFDAEMKEVPGFELPKFSDFSSPRWAWGEATDPPLTSWAVEFLNGYRQQEPFLLSVSYHNPHDICYYPYTPEKFPDPDGIDVLPPLPPNHELLEDESEFIQQRRDLGRYGEQLRLVQKWPAKTWKGYIHEYYRMVERVDAEIKQVLDALNANGMEENTLVLFTSDHGDGLGAHKWVGKLSFYEEPMTVPLILSWKGRIPGGVVDRDHLVSAVDIFPTCCDYAGVETPAVQRGASLRSIVENPAAGWREHLVAELADNDADKDRRGRMVRTSRYKYAAYTHGARNEQLFDLLVDPGETQNLAYEPSLREIRARHRELLRAWLERTKDEFKFVVSDAV